MAESTEGKCVVCNGMIVEKVVRRFNPMSGPLIIGPGSRQQFHEVSEGFYCQDCGLMYKFPPVPKKKPVKKTRIRTKTSK